MEGRTAAKPYCKVLANYPGHKEEIEQQSVSGQMLWLFSGEALTLSEKHRITRRNAVFLAEISGIEPLTS